MFHAIAIIRPQLVVWENVQGALSASAFSLMEPDQGHLGGRPTGPVLRALGRVLGDLAGIGYDATWTTVHASDVGAPHKRARVFVVAHPHGEPWLERWEPTTRETPGRRSWADVSGRDRTPQTLIPTPTASDWKAGYHQEGKGMSLSQATRLLPTPVAQASGNSAEAHLRKKPGRTQVTDLGIIAREGLFTTGGNLLPTPQATNATYSSAGYGANLHETAGTLRASSRTLGNHHRTHSPSPDRTTPTRGRQAPLVCPLRRMAHGLTRWTRHGCGTLSREDATCPRQRGRPPASSRRHPAMPPARTPSRPRGGLARIHANQPLKGPEHESCRIHPHAQA